MFVSNYVCLFAWRFTCGRLPDYVMGDGDVMVSRCVCVMLWEGKRSVSGQSILTHIHHVELQTDRESSWSGHCLVCVQCTPINLVVSNCSPRTYTYRLVVETVAIGGDRR